jgi:hypothetical protein
MPHPRQIRHTDILVLSAPTRRARRDRRTRALHELARRRRALAHVVDAARVRPCEVDVIDLADCAMAAHAAQTALDALDAGEDR